MLPGGYSTTGVLTLLGQWFPQLPSFSGSFLRDTKTVAGSLYKHDSQKPQQGQTVAKQFLRDSRNYAQY